MTTNEERLLAVSSSIVAPAIKAALNETGIGHICVLLADASTPDEERTEMALVSDIDVYAVPGLLRQFADQLEARLAS
jgi:hypothetical protein